MRVLSFDIGLKTLAWVYLEIADLPARLSMRGKELDALIPSMSAQATPERILQSLYSLRDVLAGMRCDLTESFRVISWGCADITQGERCTQVQEKDYGKLLRRFLSTHPAISVDDPSTYVVIEKQPTKIATRVSAANIAIMHMLSFHYFSARVIFVSPRIKTSTGFAGQCFDEIITRREAALGRKLRGTERRAEAKKYTRMELQHFIAVMGKIIPLPCMEGWAGRPIDAPAEISGHIADAFTQIFACVKYKHIDIWHCGSQAGGE